MPIRFPRLSLQAWILLLTVVISASVLTVADIVGTTSSIRSVERQLGQETANTARSMAEELQLLAPRSFPARFPAMVREVMEREPLVVRIDVYADFGQDLRLLASSSDKGDRPLEGKEIAAYYKGKADTFIIADSPIRKIFAIHPIRLPDGTPGFLTVVSSLRTVDEIWNTHSRIRLYSILISTALLVVGITVLFRSFVYRRIHHLVQVMHRFQGGEAGARAHEGLGGEFADLVANFNGMLTQIERLNSHMQEQIQEATGELASRNEELRGLNRQLFDLQQRLAQSERLALVGQLTATFAHEIGSPLSAVSTHLQLLLEDRRLDEKTRGRVRLALDQVDRVCGTVEGLLAKTRRRRPWQRLELAVVVRQVTHLLGPVLDARRVELGFTAPEESYAVEGDLEELQQLFLNLFRNALDAMDGPGRLDVILRRSGRAFPDGRAWIEADVGDTGAGIPDELQERIFEPFFTSKDFGKGTGLGLPVCREIAQRHGGTIQVSSAPGRGSVFTVRLPEAPASESIGPIPQPAKEAFP